MKRLRYVALALATLGLTMPARVVQGEGCRYAYADDVATDKVESDSYEHSPVLAQPPIDLPAWLMYVTYGASVRGLGFFRSDEPGNPATLKYRFPLGGSSGVTEGTLDFELLFPESGQPSIAYVSVSYDGTTTAYRYPVPAGVHVQTYITPPGIVDKVYVTLESTYAVLDNLSVCLDVTTPTRRLTWGEVKSRYR